MHVTLVNVHVKHENVDEFVAATRANASASVEEPGNVRFDVLQSAEDPCRFVLYEAYVTSEDAAAHKQTDHYQKWRATVADWMASPRVGMPFRGVFP